MSLTTTNAVDVRFTTALASIKLVSESGLLDLVEEDLEFLTRDTPWINTDRSRARRCIESATYGAIDYLGLPRMAVPAEFIAGVIAFFVKPVNTLTAATIMDGCEFSEHIISGIDRPVKANELVCFILRVRGGICLDIEKKLAEIKANIAQGLI